ncbi:hypothetical protein EVAR_83286_1 [Eumeta japonica]|uniref:Uncharacterized protein n=1 Tax=Eumeta variegata TaxID=151549 RepID=A0A4C1XB91_EUMVA|nr:hypothetical protein EVAR_83286_1 [Eumeta japonica]
MNRERSVNVNIYVTSPLVRAPPDSSTTSNRLFIVVFDFYNFLQIKFLYILKSLPCALFMETENDTSRNCILSKLYGESVDIFVMRDTSDRLSNY